MVVEELRTCLPICSHPFVGGCWYWWCNKNVCLVLEVFAFDRPYQTNLRLHYISVCVFQLILCRVGGICAYKVSLSFSLVGSRAATVPSVDASTRAHTIGHVTYVMIEVFIKQYPSHLGLAYVLRT